MTMLIDLTEFLHLDDREFRVLLKAFKRARKAMRRAKRGDLNAPDTFLIMPGTNLAALCVTRETHEQAKEPTTGLNEVKTVACANCGEENRTQLIRVTPLKTRGEMLLCRKCLAWHMSVIDTRKAKNAGEGE
jgi:hypothetical protein